VSIVRRTPFPRNRWELSDASLAIDIACRQDVEALSGAPQSAIVAGMSEETDSKSYEERAWQYFLQLQPTITDVNAAAELAFRAVDAFNRGLKKRRPQES
jgi:hypothetical protein